jgi:hypothetical protein
MPWASPDLYVNFLVWLYYYRILQKARSQGGANFYFARYEDIVASPESQFRNILHFLGLPYEAAVASGWGNTEGVPEREYGWKGRALRPITRERVGAFRRELDEGQLAALERLGRDALLGLGYELVTGGRGRLSPAFFLKLAWNLGKWVWRLPWASVVNELCGRGSFASGEGPASAPVSAFPRDCPLSLRSGKVTIPHPAAASGLARSF